MNESRPLLAVVGTAYHTPTRDHLQVLGDVTIVVDQGGVISDVHDSASLAASDAIRQAHQVVRLTADQRLLPGLIDLHIHAPQWPQVGTGLDIPLERWLFDYTFPLEARYADLHFADAVWGHMVPTLLAHGTTTAVYFSSVHERATQMLAEYCMRLGQRAYVGRVAMDHPQGTPDWYRDASPDAGIQASERSIQSISAMAAGQSLVQPIITPRFIPACSDQLLVGLAELAARTGVLVQTHCSESDWEHRIVLERFGRSDTAMLNDLGLLQPGTVLAHGNHLGDSDFDLISHAQAGVAHCPLSNSYFGNAVFPVRRALEHGVKVGLGTDVAGGAQPGLLAQSAMAVTASRMLEDGVDPARSAGQRGSAQSRLDIVSAFHLATAGGADVLGIPAGRLQVGCYFDAFVVDLASSRSGLRRWDGIDDEPRLFEKIVRLAGPSDINAVWVAGRQCSGASQVPTSTS